MSGLSSIILGIVAFVLLSKGLTEANLWTFLMGFFIALVIWRENSTYDISEEEITEDEEPPDGKDEVDRGRHSGRNSHHKR